MDNDIPLRSLQVNGQPFFAPSRHLTLAGTGCPNVLKLSWLVHSESTSNHFIWLLSRLARCATVEPPWGWESRNADFYATPVRFRAWLVSPVGYEGHGVSVYTQFHLHCYLAPDEPAEDRLPAFCPAGCNHALPLAARETFATAPTVAETLREARRQLFATRLHRWTQCGTK